jgi:hypothetical protein
VTGGLRLVTNRPALLAMLQADYAKMIASSMFYGETPTFSEILVRLKALEAAINDG